MRGESWVTVTVIGKSKGGKLGARVGVRNFGKMRFLVFWVSHHISNTFSFGSFTPGMASKKRDLRISQLEDFLGGHVFSREIF